MSTYADNSRGAYKKGVRSGSKSVLTFGQYGASPVYMHRTVGSFKTDRDARYKDTQAFGSDVRRGQRSALGR